MLNFDKASISKDRLFTIASRLLILVALIAFIWSGLGILVVNSARKTEEKNAAIKAAIDHPADWLEYKGTIYHIFFHSLVLDPSLAFSDPKRGKSYEDYMITRSEFEKMLDELYQNQFVLVDISSIYTVNADGVVLPKDLYLPKGKKPLIVSLDDLNYYPYMKGKGFADKLVLDANGEVATEVPTSNGSEVITRDGDIVPILDDFVKAHPDFSIHDAKGVIAETGFAGVLGYRTQSSNTVNRQEEIDSAKKVVTQLKATGWKFASHSYSHELQFLNGTITADEVKQDLQRWKDEVGTIVGPTDIYIGPFGQVFKPGDPRRQAIVDSGFRMLCGVGMELYLRYFPDYVMMDRADIDGLRLSKYPNLLTGYFDVEKIRE